MAQVGKAGFTEVETFGYSVDKGFFGTSVHDFKSMLDDNGLKATSNHFDFNSMIKDGSTDLVKAYVETANHLGSEYITVPYVVQELRGVSGDDYKKLAEQVNKFGELCKAGGLKLAYHNHDFEFTKFGDTNGYEILLNETDKNLVDFEMDIYWVVAAGADPIAYLKKYPNRFKLCHVKDLIKTSTGHESCILGKGTIDFKNILYVGAQNGLKFHIIEQEAYTGTTELDCAKENAIVLNNLDWRA